MGYYNPYVTIGNIILYILNNQVFLMLNYSDLTRWRTSASADTPKQENRSMKSFHSGNHLPLLEKNVTIHILKLQDFS